MWRNPRVATSMQFLLEDPNPRVNVPEFGGFADGLEYFGGKHKPAYNAYRMPLYLPSTQAARGRSLEVWGAIRPAHFAHLDTHTAQQAQIQFQRGSRGAFETIKTVTITNPRGYFDVKVTFPASGSVRLAWTAPSDTTPSDTTPSNTTPSNNHPAEQPDPEDHCPVTRAGRLLAVGIAAMFLASVSPAIASRGQESMLQDDIALSGPDTDAVLAQLRTLGVGRIRVSVHWLLIAPQPGSVRRPSGFNAADPGAYPAANWVTLDRIVTQAAEQHFDLDLDVGGGAPLWATVAGAPRDGRPHYNWAPKAREFELFMRALAIRYSGTYDPTTDRQSADDPNNLPAIHFWSLWNEPNYGPSLAPQGDPHEAGHSSVERSAWTYRNLLDAGWSALHATGHGGDTILFGEVAPAAVPATSSGSSMAHGRCSFFVRCTASTPGTGCSEAGRQRGVAVQRPPRGPKAFAADTPRCLTPAALPTTRIPAGSRRTSSGWGARTTRRWRRSAV